jgi:hypothetical protein
MLVPDMRIIVCAGLVLALFIGSVAHAMTSTNYGINWDSVNSGGDDTGSSTNYTLRDTIGEQAVGPSTSTNYSMRAGYRQGDTETTVIRFDIGTQVNSSETTYTAFDDASMNVTVSSAVLFSTGTFIGVVENRGLSQIIAVGKIVSIVGTVMTVDAWEGSPGSLSPIPAGGNDFVYRLDGNAAELGVLTSSVGKTSLTHTTVVTNLVNGYTVYVNTDGELRYGANAAIAQVTDGTVTLGTEEYGARVYGTTATSTGSDFGLATSTRPIQTSETFADDDRIGLIYKIAITGSTPAGSYSQSVFYTITPNL